MFDFPMWPMGAFITPPEHYDTAGAASALASNRNALLTHKDREAQLAEEKRQFNIKEPVEQFKTFGEQYTANRGQEEVEKSHDTQLLQWIHSVVQQDPAAAEKSAPFLHGILQSRGIDMQWDPGTGTPVGASTAQPNAGESFHDFYGRLVHAAPAGVPKSGTTEDMIQRHLAEVGAPSAEPPAEAPTPIHRNQAMPPPGSPLWQQFAGIAQQPEPQAPDVQPPEEVQAEAGPGLGKPAPEPPPEPAQPKAAPGKTKGPAAEGLAVPDTAPPAEASRGRWVFSKNGKELGAIDMGQIAAFQQKRASAEAEGFASNVLPKEDQAFVKEITRRLVEAGTPPDQVHEIITKTVEPELHRRSYERASMAAASSRAQTGGGSQERLGYDSGAQVARNYLADAGMPDITKGLAQVPQIRAKLASGNYDAVVSAIYGFARMNDPRGIVTDKDYEHALGKTLWDKVKDIFYATIPMENAPNLNPDEIKRMSEAVGVLEQGLKARRAEIIAGARARMKRMPSADMQNGALDTFDSAFTGAEEWKSGEATAPKGNGGSPKATVTERTSVKHGSLSDEQRSLLEKLQK